MEKRKRASLQLLAPIIFISAVLLIGWGIDSLPSFFANPARTGFFVSIFAGYVAGVISRIELNPFRKGKTKGRRWPIILGISVVPFVLGAVSFCDRRGIFVFPDAGVIRWIGLASFAIGESIRLVALHELGRQYSAFLTIQSQHELVRTGLYRRIRHPFYLGTLLTVPGMMLVFRSPVSIIAFLASIIFVATRIGREENLLISEFPEAYREYQRNSWRLLPYVY